MQLMNSMQQKLHKNNNEQKVSLFISKINNVQFKFQYTHNAGFVPLYIKKNFSLNQYIGTIRKLFDTQLAHSYKTTFTKRI